MMVYFVWVWFNKEMFIFDPVFISVRKKMPLPSTNDCYQSVLMHYSLSRS